MNDHEDMFYVAADPDQPGAAWAACVDEPRYAQYTAKDLAEWVSNGAIIMRVTNNVAIEMLRKWVRPQQGEPTTINPPITAKS